MKYNVTNKTATTCIITLIPESEIDQSVLKQTHEEFTFQHHYQQALKRYVDKDATFVEILNFDNYPKSVPVKFKIARGLGGF